MTMPMRLAAAAAIGVLAVGGAFYLDETRPTRDRWSEPGAQCESDRKRASQPIGQPQPGCHPASRAFMDRHRRHDRGRALPPDGHAAARWQGARGGRRRLPPRRRLRTGLGRTVRPGQRVLDRHREHGHGPRGSHGHAAARRQGARGGRRTKQRRTIVLGRTVRPGQRVMDRHREHGRGRVGHTATLLPDGKVLVAGGSGKPKRNLASAELYDPASGSWTATGNMIEGRTLTRPRCCPMARCSWRAAGTPRHLGLGRAVRPGQRVLDRHREHGRDQAAGDGQSNGHAAARWQGAGGGRQPSRLGLCRRAVRPQQRVLDFTGPMSGPAHLHTATLLPDGKVLVAGGTGHASALQVHGPLASAELYDPGTGSWAAAGNMIAARGPHGHAAARWQGARGGQRPRRPRPGLRRAVRPG